MKCQRFKCRSCSWSGGEFCEDHHFTAVHQAKNAHDSFMMAYDMPCSFYPVVFDETKKDWIEVDKRTGNPLTEDIMNDLFESTFSKHMKLVIEQVSAPTLFDSISSIEGVSPSRRGKDYFFFKGTKGQVEIQIIGGDSMTIGDSSYEGSGGKVNVPGAKYLLRSIENHNFSSLYSEMKSAFEKAGLKCSEPKAQNVQMGGYSRSGYSPMYYVTYTYMGVLGS